MNSNFEAQLSRAKRMGLSRLDINVLRVICDMIDMGVDFAPGANEYECLALLIAAGTGKAPPSIEDVKASEGRLIKAGVMSKRGRSAGEIH